MTTHFKKKRLAPPHVLWATGMDETVSIYYFKSVSNDESIVFEKKNNQKKYVRSCNL